jgi:hypothetical protein
LFAGVNNKNNNRSIFKINPKYFLSKKTNKNIKYYSTKIVSNEIQLENLDPWFITGFSDAESTFSISCFKDKKLKLG